MFNDTGVFLTQDQVLELSKTEAGKAQVKRYLHRARLAYTVQCVLESLNIVPDPDQQQLVCEVLERCLSIESTPTQYILAYIDSFKKHVEDNSINGTYFSDEQAGNC